MADLTTPNFTQAAEQQAAGNLTGAQTATTANRVNQYNPFGAQTWSQDPNTSMWSQTTAFSPEQQNVWDQFMQSGSQFGDATQSALQNWQNPSYGGVTPSQYGAQAAQSWQNPYFGGVNPQQLGQTAMDQYQSTDRFGGVTPNAAGLQSVADTLYGADVSRLDPEWQQRQSMENTQLYNQGLRPGGEAYDAAKRNTNQAQNDAYLQARAKAMASAQSAQQALFGMGQSAQNQAFNQAGSAYGMGQQGNQQSYDQMSGLYGMGLQGSNAAFNQATGARSQTSPTNPQFSNFYQQQATTGPNYLGAMGEQYQGQLDIYNADVAKQNAMIQGLYGLGSGILGLPTGSGSTLGGQLLGPMATSAGNWLTGLMSGSGTTGYDLPNTAGTDPSDPFGVGMFI